MRNAIGERAARRIVAGLNQARDPQAFQAAELAPSGSIADLEGHDHCLVVSYREDGSPVPTPVWFGMEPGRVYFRSGAEHRKLDRMRREPAVLVAACDEHGKPLSSPFRATARFLDDPQEIARAERAIRANHGLRRRVYLKTVQLGVAGVYVELTPAG